MSVPGNGERVDDGLLQVDLAATNDQWGLSGYKVLDKMRNTVKTVVL